MKHNLRRVLHLTEARTFWVRAVRAWRNLLPDWTPTLDALRELETMPHEHRAAVAVVSEGWQSNDPRWDVLMALLEWERRQAKEQARQEYWVKPGAFERLMDAVREDYEVALNADIDTAVAQALTPVGGVKGNPLDYHPEDEQENGASRQAAEADGKAPVCPPGECTWPDCACPEVEQPPVRETVVIPLKVVQNNHVVSESETTVETPLKAFFLDNVRPIKHLSEKEHAGSHLPSPEHDDVPGT